MQKNVSMFTLQSWDVPRVCLHHFCQYRPPYFSTGNFYTVLIDAVDPDADNLYQQQDDQCVYDNDPASEVE